MKRNFLRSLAAVLGGNAIYYLSYRSLPPAVQHQVFTFDAGLLLDGLFCVVLFLLLNWFDCR
ncbi:MAG TPA: hypothetical protein VGR50_01455 [Terriglobales bacterium]|nr:hypothetical protein [Terriglobales bacterium]